MSVAKYYYLAKSDFLEKVTYGWSQFFGITFIGIILFIYLHIWTAIYAGKPSIEGFSLAQMIWYLAVTEASTSSSATNWMEKIGEEVKSGQFASALLKPMNYAYGKFALNLANFFFMLPVMLGLSLLMAFIFTGPIALSVKGVILSLVALTIGTVLNFTIVLILGLSVFWFEDNTAFYWIYQKCIFILGGMIVPLDVYPQWLQGIVFYLPFSFIVYMPAKLFVAYSDALFMQTLIGQLAWLVPSTLVLLFVYKRALKEANINGG